MWKKIVYYASMIFIGITLMIAASVTFITSRYEKLYRHSIKTGDYSNILGVSTKFSNKNALDLEITTTDSKTKVFVFESALDRDTPYLNKNNEYETKPYFDIQYTIIIVHDDRVSSDKQKDGQIYNTKGIEITNSVGEAFTYYDNRYKDGVISKENKEFYNGYNLTINTIDSLDVFIYGIPYDFIKNYSGFTTYDIKSMAIKDSSNNTYASITAKSSALAYSSETFDKLNELKPLFNKAVDGDEKDINAVYKTWKKEFLAISGAMMALSNKAIFNTGFWFKIVGTGILYILLVLILGDILVGKRRIFALFQNLRKTGDDGSFTNPTQKKNPVKEGNVRDITKPIDAEINSVTEIVEDDKNEKN